MGLFSWLKPKNASPENPSTPLSNPAEWLVEWFGGGPTASGVTVSEETAIRCGAVYACVSLLAQSIASLPLHVYKRTDDGRTKAREHQLFGLLHDQPNLNMTSAVCRELLMTHVLLSGNAYAVIGRNRAGRAVDLLPIFPHAVTVERKDGRLLYRVSLEDGGQEIFDQSDMIHVPGMMFNGVTGLSPISAFRQAIGLALATEQYGAELFKNGARPGGVLEHPEALGKDARDNLRQSWQETYGGLSNAHKVAILEEGMTFKPLAMNSNDAQFLETRKFQVEEIARIFRVPLHLIAHVEKSTSWGSGIEQQSIGFVIYTLRPWLTKIEQELNRKLFERDADHYVEHDVNGLLRGDTKSQSEMYASAIQNAWMTPNEVRRTQNLPALPGGDGLLIQTNITPITQMGSVQEETNAD